MSQSRPGGSQSITCTGPGDGHGQEGGLTGCNERKVCNCWFKMSKIQYKSCIVHLLMFLNLILFWAMRISLNLTVLLHGQSASVMSF